MLAHGDLTCGLPRRRLLAGGHLPFPFPRPLLFALCGLGLVGVAPTGPAADTCGLFSAGLCPPSPTAASGLPAPEARTVVVGGLPGLAVGTLSGLVVELLPVDGTGCLRVIYGPFFAHWGTGILIYLPPCYSLQLSRSIH